MWQSSPANGLTVRVAPGKSESVEMINSIAYAAVYDPISIFTMLLAINLIKDPVLDMVAFHISLV